MPSKEVQIVAFNNPYPPNFGGVIDVFYKVKALSELGVSVHLHIFYEDIKDISGLKPFCKSISLYKKKTSLINHLALQPYCVKSRDSNKLITSLKQIEAPIILESLRTTGLLKKATFSQKIAVRCHNIEHDYSWGLFKSEKNWIKKMAYLFEGYKLKYYESVLNKVDVLFPISFFEHSYYLKHFKTKSIFLPVFQGDTKVASSSGFGTYALYHGDLSRSDNIRSALFLVNVFQTLQVPLVIASSTVVNELSMKVKKYNNISFELIKDENHLDQLIENAHINTLYSFQRSGTKLKVFKALYKGRHCVLNKNMVDDPDILRICEIAEGKKDYQDVVLNLFKTKFEIKEERTEALRHYDAKYNAQKIIDEMF